MSITLSFADAETAIQTRAANSDTGHVIFVNRKNTQPTPLIVRFFGDLLPVPQVFDQTLQQSFTPAEGEKHTVKYLVNGIGSDGQGYIYQVGSTVVEEAAKIFRLLKKKVVVSISSTGQGKATEYRVDHFEGDFPMPTVKPVEQDLATVAAQLVGPRPGTVTNAPQARPAVQTPSRPIQPSAAPQMPVSAPSVTTQSGTQAAADQFGEAF